MRTAAGAAGMPAPAPLGRLEAVTATAAGDRVGVEHSKPGAHQAVDVVDLGALQVPGRETVDDDPETVDFVDHVVSQRGVIQSHSIGEPGAATRLNPHAQAQAGIALLLDHVPQLAYGVVCKSDQLGLNRHRGGSSAKT